MFDKCTPIRKGEAKSKVQLLMRYTKNGKTVNNAPAFDEMDMMKAIVKLYNSTLISSEAKKILNQGIK